MRRFLSYLIALLLVACPAGATLIAWEAKGLPFAENAIAFLFLMYLIAAVVGAERWSLDRKGWAICLALLAYAIVVVYVFLIAAYRGFDG